MAKFDARAAGTKVRKIIAAGGPTIVAIGAIMIAQTNVTGSMFIAAIVVGVAQAMAYGRGEHAGWLQGSKEMAEFAVKRPLNVNVETSIKLVNNTDERLTLAH